MIFLSLIERLPELAPACLAAMALAPAGMTLATTIALALIGGAYAIGIIRGGVEAIPKGQIEAGLALGLHKAQIFRFIVLKPALRAVYPSLIATRTRSGGRG